ncbi:MAG: Arc family DNA-binding protein [Deltaproteobacteria bacterium]|nr:MAG: Arc family DNA-binding protein [Deltaproteobacteria bacterium]
MAQLIVRNLPDEVVEQIKETAARKGHSMEQEVRQLLKQKYQPKHVVLEKIQERWSELPETSAEEASSWIREGRD